MNKYAKGTVIGLVVVSAGFGVYHSTNELQKYKNELESFEQTERSLRATLQAREESLSLTELELSEAKLGLEAEVAEKGELKDRLKDVEAKYRHTSEEVKSLKKTLALLNNELKSKSE